MATKKAAPKKSTTTKTAKSTSAKTSKKATPAKKNPELQSFRACPEPTPFMTFKITRQTVYWLIIAAISIVFVLWILQIQEDISQLYTHIETIQQQDL